MVNKVKKDLSLAWDFIKRDMSIILSPIFFTGISCINSSTPLLQSFFYLGESIIIFFLFLLLFCMSNQIVGLEEDKINKPDRPLVQGKITPKETLIRWFIGMTMLTVLGWYLGVFYWVLSLQISIILYDFFGWGKHWLSRNILLSILAYGSLITSWTLVNPLSSIILGWVLVLSISFGLLINVQELRDLEGDREIERKTLPIVIGEEATRIILCVGILILICVVFLFFNFFALFTLSSSIWFGSLVVLSHELIRRILLNRDTKGNNTNYKIMGYYYLLLTLGSLFIN